MRVIADDRERAGGVVALLAARADVECIVERLEAGDFRVEDRVIAERKTLRDFAASLIDGRLFAQAANLVARAFRVRRSKVH